MKIVVADDDRQTRKVIEIMCRDEPFQMLFAENGKQALQLISENEDIHLLLADRIMPEMGGEELLVQVQRKYPDIPVIIITSQLELNTESFFLKAGAIDYITKPINKDVLLHRIQSVLGYNRITKELSDLRSHVQKEKAFQKIVGKSAPIVQILKKIPFVAKTDASIVVTGESGTGKELVARAIHEMSERSDRNFVTINCGALPENLLETELFGYKEGAFTDAKKDYDGIVKKADGGTLFLDEIGEISLNMQVKLLRFLQEKEYRPLGSNRTIHTDVRFVSATNRNLEEEISLGHFREDLFYRLNIIPIRLPSLQERKEDIGLLANHFLHKFKQQEQKHDLFLTPSAIESMEQYHWPGNIRELENKIFQVVVLSEYDAITEDILALGDPKKREKLSSPLSWIEKEELLSFKEEKEKVLEQFEKFYIEKMLAMNDGNITQSAKRAKMDRKNFWQKMKKYHIESSDIKE